MSLDILRQWRVDIKSTSQKTFLRNLGDDELKDYSGGLSMSHRPREGTFPHSLLKCRYIHQDSTHSPRVSIAITISRQTSNY